MPASIIASASSAKYAGPGARRRAVTASIDVLGHAHDAAEVQQHLLGEREVLVARVRAGADAGHALVHGRRRVRHRAHDRHAVGDPRLDVRGRDRGRDREDGLLAASSSGADLAEQRVDVLRLHRDDDERGARDRVGVRGRRLDAVPLAQLVDARSASRVGDDDLVAAPAGAEQPGEQRLADLAARRGSRSALALRGVR